MYYDGALITFGCSWTFGLGLCYEDGMSKTDYRFSVKDSSITAANHKYSFRYIIASNNNLEEFNFAKPGESNQYNFRVAKEFFNSNEYTELKSKYGNNIYVLWGITSIHRHEEFNVKTQQWQRAKFYPTDFNPEKCIDDIRKKIEYYNVFFEEENINILWFDTFNHHDYKFVSNDNNMLNENKHKRDLMSLLNEKFSNIKRDDNYHMSGWLNDTNILNNLVRVGILNEHSYHPTKKAHEYIASVLNKEMFKYDIQK